MYRSVLVVLFTVLSTSCTTTQVVTDPPAPAYVRDPRLGGDPEAPEPEVLKILVEQLSSVPGLYLFNPKKGELAPVENGYIYRSKAHVITTITDLSGEWYCQARVSYWFTKDQTKRYYYRLKGFSINGGEPCSLELLLKDEDLSPPD